MKPSSLRGLTILFMEVPSQENLLAVDVIAFKTAVGLKETSFQVLTLPEMQP